MSDYKPITGELRKYVGIDRGVCYMSEERFDARCDEIDAIHAQLERENAALKAELDLVRGKQEEHQHSIVEVTATITPTLDWSAVALELHSLACHLAGDAS